jgi:hypothetical protein
LSGLIARSGARKGSALLIVNLVLRNRLARFNRNRAKRDISAKVTVRGKEISMEIAGAPQ